MTIANKHFSTVAFLTDLNIQCRLFKRSYERLKVAKKHWLNISNGIKNGTNFTPLEIISECTVCLSAMSAIKRVLDSSEVKKRSDLLMKLLNEPVLTHVFTKKVRNSWEHHDERLDKLLKNLNVGDRLCDIHVSATPPHERSFILKRFDPTTMTIHFLDDMIELDPCLEEIQALTACIDNAFTRLSD